MGHVARWRACALAIIAAVWLSPATASGDRIPAIAAAADLRFALSEIAKAFTKETGRQVRISFGSSGNLRRQIAQGAPFEMYLSADERYVSALAGEGLTHGRGSLYAVGRIGIFTPRVSPIRAEDGLQGLAAALADGRVNKFAIAHPEHAPYGRATRDTLMKAKLWEAIQRRLVLGENASQATQFAATGSTEGGIIPYSLWLGSPVSNKGRFALLPAEWHKPLRQRMVLLKRARDTARQFYNFVKAPPGRKILQRHGFLIPD